MTRILLSYRQESESTTHDNSDNISDTNVSDISNNEVRETTTETSTTVEELRNYDTHQSAVVEVVNFESLELKIHELITTELDTQIKLDELIMLQKQQYTISFSLFIGLALIVILTIMYKVITFSFF